MAEVNDSGSVKDAFDFALDKLGYEKLRPEQDKVLRAFVSGRDALLPCPLVTGSHCALPFCPLCSTA